MDNEESEPDNQEYVPDDENLSIDDLTIGREEEGEEVVKVLEKKILTRGAWATIMYLYQEMDRKSKEYKPMSARIVRYHKMKGRYRQHSKLNISNAKQGLEVAETLREWFSAPKK